MAKKITVYRPAIPDAELDTLQQLHVELFTPYGMTVRDYATKDGSRNLRTARALDNHRNLKLLFSGEEHGADAWLVRGTILEELEMKSMLEGKKFEFYTYAERETPELLDRLASTSFLFSVFRRGEQLLMVYYLPAGSSLNAVFEERLRAISAGAERKRSPGMTLNRLLEHGPIRLL